MATKQYILNIEEGVTQCIECPLQDCAFFHDPIKCSNLNWNTAEFKELPTAEMIDAFIDVYSQYIWQQQMLLFSTRPDYRIRSNDAADLVRNAMRDMYDYLLGKQPEEAEKISTDTVPIDKIVPAKTTTIE